MPGPYRVVDLRDETAAEYIVPRAASVEQAADKALGLKLQRSGRPPDLVAKVYFSSHWGSTTMVRLYSKPA